MKRPINQIAAEIYAEWGRGSVALAARPYLEAMACLESITDTYGADDARGIVLYFLSNAGGWRGTEAKRLKAELKELLK